MKIIYTPEAISDLEQLREFITEENPKAAKRIANALQYGIKKLKEFPKLGLEVKKANSELIRDLILGDYTVRYLILKESFYILRTWHQKEDWEKTSKGELPFKIDPLK